MNLRPIILLPLFASLAVVIAGCSAETTASAACEDTIDAFVDASMRCGSTDREAARKEYTRIAAAGDCKNVKKIRDEVQLRGTCFPWIQKADCKTLQLGPVDESCGQQLLREQ
jgi:hypothetical protein